MHHLKDFNNNKYKNKKSNNFYNNQIKNIKMIRNFKMNKNIIQNKNISNKIKNNNNNLHYILNLNNKRIFFKKHQFNQFHIKEMFLQIESLQCLDKKKLLIFVWILIDLFLLKKQKKVIKQ